MEIVELVWLITASLVLATAFWYAWTHRSSKRRTLPSPPGPRGLPIVGYIPFLRPDLPRQFTELPVKYGPIFKIRLGSKLWVVISSPDLIKQVVRDQDAVFANRDPRISGLIASGGIDIVFSPNGMYWREMRKLFVKETLSNTSLQGSHAVRREGVRDLIRNLSCQQGKSVRIGELIFSTELNVMTSLLWGSTFSEENEKNELRRLSLEMLELLAKPHISDFLPILATFDIQSVARDTRRIVSKFHEILDSVIQDKITRTKAEVADTDEGGPDPERRSDILEILLKLHGRQLEDGSTFGAPQIKAVLLDMLVAGTDTTATVVEWVMTNLLAHPEIMAKVQQELSYVVGNDNLVEEPHIHKLHYLDAVIKESLRLHPPGYLIRTPHSSRIVGGYEIPRGSMVVLNTWSVHEDPQFWKETSKFCPERFMEDDPKFDYLGNNFNYHTFGSGRRSCPGITLAEKMGMYLAATLVHSFEWRCPEGEKLDMSENFGFVTKINLPLVAVPQRSVHITRCHL